MTIYISQGRYTESAIKGMAAKPEDRATEVAKLAQAAGGRLLSYYVTFGEYDFLAVFEGDDNLDMLAALIGAGATGGVTDLRTTVAVTSIDATKAMEKAGQMAKSFRAAGT